MCAHRFDLYPFWIGLLLICLGLPAAASQPIGTASNAVGSLIVTHADGIEERLRGKGALPLYEGDVLSTDAASQALIELRDGTRVGLDKSTRVRLLLRWEKDKGETHILRMATGTLWLRTGSRARPLEVETPVASAAPQIGSGDVVELMMSTLDNGNSMLSVIDGVVPFGTAFGTCPIKPGTVSYAVQGKKCTKPVALDSRRATGWMAAIDPAWTDGQTPEVAAQMQAFWPPPDTSTRQILPHELLVADPARAPTLAALAAKMAKALSDAGYDTSPSYYPAPGGFALVTQLERIYPDASPYPDKERWKIRVAPDKRFNLQAYLKALLGRDASRFRVIAFVFTAAPISGSSGRAPDIKQARGWVDGGLDKLPIEVGPQTFNADMACTALIYEFEIPSHGAPAVQLKPSEHSGQRHLRAARIIQALGG